MSIGLSVIRGRDFEGTIFCSDLRFSFFNPTHATTGGATSVLATSQPSATPKEPISTPHSRQTPEAGGRGLDLQPSDR